MAPTREELIKQQMESINAMMDQNPGYMNEVATPGCAVTKVNKDEVEK